MSSELKPCPFCGGEAERITLEDEDNFGGDVIACSSCQACSHVEFDRKENLVDAWNTRHPSRNDVLEEAARVADQEQLRAKAEVETYETGCAYRTAALAEMGLAARFAQSIRALKDRDG